MRIATRRTAWFAGLISQNGNAYVEGLSPLVTPPPGETPGQAAQRHRQILTLEATRSQYETGATNPERIDPDSWTLDQRVLDIPGRDRVMLDLLLDYGTNIELYPRWQAWLRERQPPLLLAWGRNDPFLVESGAKAYLRDVPDAELHLFDTGHFALEEHVSEIAVARKPEHLESGGALSIKDYAVAVVDEAEQSRGLRRRFTVAY